MTPKEYAAAANALSKRMGANLSIHTYVADRDTGDVLSAAVYRDWPRRDMEFRVVADDFVALLVAVEVKWKDHEAQFRRQITRKMALAIMRITAEHDHCTDAALRQEFSDEEVKRFGSDACADANTIAGKGPFEIITLGGANGAPVEVEGARAQ